MKKFSVLTYNIDGYEILHEIPKEAINPDAEYIYVTDDHSITSNTWTVIYADDLTGSTFDKCYQIRFFPFKYVNSNIVMRIDGSMMINKDVTPIIDKFEQGQYDACVLIHNIRNTIEIEYDVWCKTRNYPMSQSKKVIEHIKNKFNYDVKNYKGLYNSGFCIQRNDEFNNKWNSMIYETLKEMATPPNTVERINQTIWSVILNSCFSDKKIMCVDNNLLLDILSLCPHKRKIKFSKSLIKPRIKPYLFNKETEIINFF